MKTIKDIDLNNKKVIIRFDYNVPIKDNKVIDDNVYVKNSGIQNGSRLILL